MSEFASLTGPVDSATRHLEGGRVGVVSAERLQDAARRDAVSQLQRDDAAHVSAQPDRMDI